MKVQIANNQNKITVREKENKIVEEVVAEIGRQFKLFENTEVSITFVDNEKIQSLNRQYRNIDNPTDVLSFALDDSSAIETEIAFVNASDLHLLGDIVISLEKAVEQANEYGHSTERELGFLTVHGMLHLLGYDHTTEEDALAMREWEEKILQQLQLVRLKN